MALTATLVLSVVFVFANIAKASTIDAENVLKLINLARVNNGIAPLKVNDKLSAAAMGKAQDMVQKKYFAHVSPDGTTPWQWLKASGYYYQYAGENLAKSFSNAEDQQQAWMNSPTHKKKHSKSKLYRNRNCGFV